MATNGDNYVILECNYFAQRFMNAILSSYTQCRPHEPSVIAFDIGSFLGGHRQQFCHSRTLTLVATLCW